MDLKDLQRNWETFGRTDPLWAILTDPTRRGNRWDPVEFFATGREEVTALFEHAARLGVPTATRRGLDFGCGAGRLTQALAQHLDRVTGVDIASSMIDAARRHNGLGDRCRFEVNDRPDLSQFADGAFDVVYTGRVLQHVEPRFAESYIREFVRVLAPGGYLSFDVPSEFGFFPEHDTVAGRPATAYRVDLRLAGVPATLEPGVAASVLVNVRNAGGAAWQAGQLNVGNHWIASDGTLTQRDDGRAAIRLPWAPDEERQVELCVTAPVEPGRYRLQVDAVEEGVTWFAELGSPIAEVNVVVGVAGMAVTRESALPNHSAAAHPTGDEATMEMHAVPRARVEKMLAEAGARLLDVRRVFHCGPTWLAFRYDVTK